MAQNPYRMPAVLDTGVELKIEKSVAESLKLIAQHLKVTEGEIVNTAMKRYIATHSDYLPKTPKIVTSK